MAELTDTQVADLVAAIDCDYHAPSYGQCSACADRIERTAEMVAEIATEHVTAALDEIEAVVAAQREAFLPSSDLDAAWIAGWHSAVAHVFHAVRGYRQEQDR